MANMWPYVQGIINEYVIVFLDTVAHNHSIDAEELKTLWSQYTQTTLPNPEDEIPMSISTARKLARGVSTTTRRQSTRTPRTTTSSSRKRGLTPYNLFFKEKRLEIVQTEPGLSLGEVSQRISALWKAVSDDEKAQLKERLNRSTLDTITEHEESVSSSPTRRLFEPTTTTTTTTMVTTLRPISEIMTNTATTGEDNETETETEDDEPMYSSTERNPTMSPVRVSHLMSTTSSLSPPFRLSDSITTTTSSVPCNTTTSTSSNRSHIIETLGTKQVKQLRDMCTEYGLKKTGNKAELIELLTQRLMHSSVSLSASVEENDENLFS